MRRPGTPNRLDLLLGLSLFGVGLLLCDCSIQAESADSSVPLERFDVRRFGAKGDGVTDDTGAINAAFEAAARVADSLSSVAGAANLAPPSGTVTFPPGIFVVRAPILARASAVGAGPGKTVLLSASRQDPVLRLERRSGIYFRGLIQGFTIKRSVEPDPTAAGVDASLGCGEGGLRDITVENNGIGFLLGTTADCLGHNLIAFHNRTHGFLLTNSGTTPQMGPLQWYLGRVLSAQNGGHGFAVISRVASTLGNWVDLTTFANSGWGILLEGSPGARISDLGLTSGFVGSDHQGLLYLNTHGNHNRIGNSTFELAGMMSHGPLSEAPTRNAHGIVITANNNAVILSNVVVSASALSGIVNWARNTTVTGFNVQGNGRAGKPEALFSAGIVVMAGSLQASGGSSTGQRYGMFTSVDELAISGVSLVGNTVKALESSVPLSRAAIAAVLPKED